NVLTATEGEAVMAHRLKGFEPWKGEMGLRNAGALVAMETGNAFPYAIDKLQDRGTFFIDANEEVYAGQVIGEHIRQDDLVINVCKSKKLTNMRASGADDAVRLVPPRKMSLEEYMEYIGPDEYLEVTPQSLRLRKIILDENERKRQEKRAAAAG
ncbi:MAG: translational GTPase TypA, partial [Bacteroidales bacterium]|nr:translational GTPase TypA [Bacteroidales bacterium]